MVLLPNIQHEDMMSLVQYMYTGQVFIHQDMLGRLLKTAQQLQVKGLIEQSGCSRSEESQVGGECENLRFSYLDLLFPFSRPAATSLNHQQAYHQHHLSSSLPFNNSHLHPQCLPPPPPPHYLLQANLPFNQSRFPVHQTLRFPGTNLVSPHH